MLPSQLGNDSAIASFAELAGQLKFVKRAGWTRFKEILEVESVADHSFRIGILAMVLKNQPNTLDISKCVKMALVHDLAEAQVGDITPFDGISKEEKTKLEFNGFKKIISPLDGKQQQELMSLWQEYEDRTTAEARLVKDLDLYEMLQQAFEYEKKYKIDLSEFFQINGVSISNQQVKQWIDMLIEQRQRMHGVWLQIEKSD